MSVVPHLIHENENKFYVDWEEGQKTGFFLDQRDNRKLLTHFAEGKNVLNTFCYSGWIFHLCIRGEVRISSLGGFI
jgi:23S rRNA (cytosine1962-C5)-methyltransferase